MTSQTLLELLIGVAVLALLIVRTVRARPVRQNPRLFLVLGVIGVFEAVQFFGHHHAGGAALTAALAGSLALAAVFGAIRALTVRVWIKEGQPWAQGNWLTAVLWVAAVAAHLGYDALLNTHKDISGLGEATILLYLVVSLVVQWFIVSERARRLDPTASSQPRWTI